MNTLTSTQIIELADCRFELLLGTGDEFRGLGRIWIDGTLVRSGRLPLRPFSETFPDGLEMRDLQFLGVKRGAAEVRVELKASFYRPEILTMRDHSFDPIHPTDDWDAPAPVGSGELDIVLRTAKDEFNGTAFGGFSYHYEYRSPDIAIFHLMDKASWELDGDIQGGTAYSQSACTPPVAHFAADTEWTTEGVLFFLVEAGNQNPVMTHNLPRWASHGSFDYQYKGDNTLIGVFERVDLIRSLLKREAGKPELKCFDKHIFDQTLEFATDPKKILLNTEPKSEVTQQNLWTWIHCAVEERARAEFGLLEEPFQVRTSWNFWDNFTTETYFEDLVPAAAAIGCREIFVDNLKKSAMTEEAPLKGVFKWNMCVAHEYVIADKLGGNEGVRHLVDQCAQDGIRVASWTNNTQGLSSPLNNTERDDKGWYVLIEDARQKYGGAYTMVMSVLDLSVKEARDYFLQTHLAIKNETGLDLWLFDSFYNLGFMPVSYREMKPRTIWRGLLQLLKECQDNGIHFLIESFGPFGMPQHGHPSTYNFETLFICYRVGLGNDYSTVPTNSPLFGGHPDDSLTTYLSLAHMAGCDTALFKDGVRIDQRWTPEHKRALADYYANRDNMRVRYLQEDGKSVLWHNADGTVATLFNFVDRALALPGCVTNLTTGEKLPQDATYSLQASHTYGITGTVLPTVL